MSVDAARASGSDRIAALIVVCVLAVASIAILAAAVRPAPVTVTELLGEARSPGQAAFIASHRGGSAGPENTLPAVRAALAAGFEYVEIDVQPTADAQLVLMHDRTVDRTTDGHGPLASLTLAEVRDLDAGAWFGEEFAGTAVPTLGEALDVLAAAGGRVILELKGEWDAAMAQALIREVSSRDLDERVLVASFDSRSLARIGAALPGLMIVKRLPADVVEAAEQVGARGIIAARRAVADRPEVVAEMHAAGLRVVVYTLNDDDEWDAVTTLGVDGIVTDEPEVLSQWQADVLAHE